MAFVVTARVGPRVERASFASLDEALDEIAARTQTTGPGRAGSARSVLGREYAPEAQVAGRFELRGPGGVRGGVDLRGDGSAVAFTGRLRRREVSPDGRETAVQALRRALSAPG